MVESRYQIAAYVEHSHAHFYASNFTLQTNIIFQYVAYDSFLLILFLYEIILHLSLCVNKAETAYFQISRLHRCADKNKIEHFFILSGDNNFTNLNFGETVNPEGSYTGTTWREEKPANVKSTTFTF